MIPGDVRDEIWFAPWRNEDERHAEAAHVKTGLKILRPNVRRDAVRSSHWDGRYMVIHPAALVEDEEKCRRAPGGAFHQRVDVRLHLGGPRLNIVAGMLVESFLSLD